MHLTARILIIDDDGDVRAVLREFLELAGYEIVEAPDGVVGLQLYREAPTDLIITDLLMPEKNGLDTILELRRDFPAAKIIAMSGGGVHQQSMLSQAKACGAARTLPKPFNLWKLLDTVQEMLAVNIDS